MVIKKYVPFAMRKAIVDYTIDACFDDSEGYWKYDSMSKDLFFHAYLIDNYTDIEFSVDSDGNYSNLLDEYDKLCEDGTLDKIIDGIGKDYFILQESLNCAVEAKLKENCAEIILAKLGNNLLNKIDQYLNPKAMDKIVKSLNKLDPKLLEQFNGILKDVK